MRLAFQPTLKELEQPVIRCLKIDYWLNLVREHNRQDPRIGGKFTVVCFEDGPCDLDQSTDELQEAT